MGPRANINAVEKIKITASDKNRTPILPCSRPQLRHYIDLGTRYRDKFTFYPPVLVVLNLKNYSTIC
jgi:hypothetical protein